MRGGRRAAGCARCQPFAKRVPASDGVNVESRSYSKITQALMAVLLSARNGETLSSLGPELASRCGISKRYAPVIGQLAQLVL